MKVKFEYELNRKWITDKETNELIGEMNLVVPAKWLEELFDKKYANEYDSLDEFTDLYEPETDGEFIYHEAVKDEVLVEDLGVVMY